MKDRNLKYDVVFNWMQFKDDAVSKKLNNDFWYFTYDNKCYDREIVIWRDLSSSDVKRANSIIWHIQSNLSKFKNWRSVVDFFREAMIAGINDGAETQRKISLSKRFDVFKKDNYSCCICGRNNESHDVILEVDHIIPISKGGTDDLINLQTLCFECNRGKKNKLM